MAARPQRGLLVRLGPQVQEVLRLAGRTLRSLSTSALSRFRPPRARAVRGRGKPRAMYPGLVDTPASLCPPESAAEAGSSRGTRGGEEGVPVDPDGVVRLTRLAEQIHPGVC